MKSDKLTEQHIFTRGWCVSLNELVALAPQCLSKGMDYVPLRRFGQDHVENLFAIVRGQNGYNDQPAYKPFQAALCSAALSNLLRPLTTGTNCHEDHDTLVASVLGSSSSSTTLPSASAVAAADADAILELEPCVDSDCEPICDSAGNANQLLYKSEMQVISYVGGYIVRKLHCKKIIGCEDCYSVLVSDKQSMFVKEKQFSYEGCAQLLTPSQQLFQFLIHVEKTFRGHVAPLAHHQQVGSTLKNLMKKNAPQLNTCHNVTDVLLTLFLQVRLHHWCKLKSIEMRKIERVDKISMKNKLAKIL